jgi:Bacterial PH domain
MFDWIRQRVLRFMRIPHDPEPPAGAPGSIRVFRAGANYYNLRLVRWGATQLGAAIGILFSVGFLCFFKSEVEMVQRALESHSSAIAPVAPVSSGTLAPVSPAPSPAKTKRGNRNDLKRIASLTPRWVIPLVEVLELGGILFFLIQLPITFAAVRLEFEMHWYIVTDRSLRIRTGLFRLQESTMSFANLQQVEVKQGPLQRLLGLADVHVQSAGGGSGGSTPRHGDSLHTGIFHSVNNATEIRDLILERLRQFRQAGLGDPDDHHDHSSVVGGVPPPREASSTTNDTLAAAREILEEARALRQALS